MLGHRSPQSSFFDTDYICQGLMTEDSFYAFLANYRDELFSDEDFAQLYSPRLGRPSVPPSILALAALLQCHDRVSDYQTWKNAQVNLEWTFALGVPPLDAPFAKSTYQNFRAGLLLNEGLQMLFERSLEFAAEHGFLSGGDLQVALDTTPVFGAGAVKDTYNLVADGIKRVIREMTARHIVSAEEWASQAGFEDYFNGSIKGQRDVDWEDDTSRQEFLRSLVDDVHVLLDWVGQLPESEKHDDLMAAAGVLADLVGQDVEYDDHGPRLRQGVAEDRIVSAHDPEMRHGRKSQQQRFDGYKGAVAVDTDSGLITAVDVVPANTHDGDTALPLVEATEAATGLRVRESIGDAAYSDATTQTDFDEADRKLVAKVPRPPRKGRFPKDDFDIDLEAGTCTCPAGHTTSDIRPGGFRTNRRGERVPISVFRFDDDLCAACPLKSHCTQGKRGRTITIHPREEHRQEARALQRSEAFDEYKRRRQVSEHRIGRLKQLGGGQSRYVGLRKTRGQWFLTAAVANFTHIWAKMRKNGVGLHRLAHEFAKSSLDSVLMALRAIWMARPIPTGLAS